VGHPGGGYPGTLEDVVEALRLLPDVGARGVEAERTVVFGHSAGGHLALWLAGEARRRMRSSSPIVGAVSLAGVTDLARAAALRLGSSAAQAFMGGEPDERPEAYALASPIARVPIQVRQTLIHGEADDTVPVALSEAYAEAARVAGDEVELEILPGAGHFELVDPRAAQWPRVVTAIRTSLDLWERSPDRDATS
jgi:acetyl esterase/lipase